MTPRFPSPLPSFRDLYTWLTELFRRGLRSLQELHGISRIRGAVRRPSRLTMGVAAAIVVTAVTAGTVASLSSGGNPDDSAITSGAVSNVSALGRAPASGLGATGEHALSASPQSSANSGTPGQGSGSQQQGTAHPTSPSLPAAAPAQSAAPVPAVTPAQPATPAQPYTFYDSVTPQDIPAGGVVATYATGEYASTPSQVADRGQVMWIDSTGLDYSANALDVEPGNVGPSGAASWAYNRLQDYPNSIAIIYTYQAEWPSVQQAVSSLPASMQSRIHWWIADPTGVPHIVPGSMATQWAWGPSYDTSEALPGFQS
jgi:hypothetical protein